MVKKLFFAAVTTLIFSSVFAPTVAAGGGGGPCKKNTLTMQTADSSPNVSMQESCFTPTLLRVVPGTTVTFVNKDPYAHALHGANGIWSFDDLIIGGQVVRQTFEQPGIYLFSCFRHPGMTGAVIASDDLESTDTKLTLVAGQTSNREVTANDEPASQRFNVIPAISFLFASLLAFGLGRLSSRRR